MKKIVTLLSMSFLLVSAFNSVYASLPGMPDFQMIQQSGMGNTGGGAGGSFALFGEREAAAEQNALLRQIQMQLQMINTNPAAKLAYLRSMRQGLGSKADVARVNGLPVGQRENALQQLYERLRAENIRLTRRQNTTMGGASNFTALEGDSVEVSLNDIALHKQQSRNIATSPTLEVGPNDYTLSMRESRTQFMSGPAEVGGNDVRNFMQQNRYG